MSMGGEMVEEVYDNLLMKFGTALFEASKTENKEGEEADYWFDQFSLIFPYNAKWVKERYEKNHVQ